MTDGVTNTTRLAKENPMLMLVDAMGDERPGEFVERMEKRGQDELVSADDGGWKILPRQLGDGYPTDEENLERRGPFEELGFVFGDPIEGDDLFQKVKLPDGWRHEGSEHAMWSYLVDADGFQRVSIFYKAAFYDRRAHMHINHVPTTRAQDLAKADLMTPIYRDPSSDWRVKDDANIDGVYRLVLHGDGQERVLEFAPDGSILSDKVA